MADAKWQPFNLTEKRVGFWEGPTWAGCWVSCRPVLPNLGSLSLPKGTQRQAAWGGTCVHGGRVTHRKPTRPSELSTPRGRKAFCAWPALGTEQLFREGTSRRAQDQPLHCQQGVHIPEQNESTEGWASDGDREGAETTPC